MTFTPKTNVALHTRKYAEGDVVSLADLQLALRTAARLVEVNQIYLPLFLRLERELQARDGQAAILRRAAAIAVGATPSA